MGSELIESYFVGFFLAVLPAIIVAVYSAFKRGISLAVPDAD